MKKSFLSLIIFLSVFSDTKAAPGDTTWVQAHSGVWLDWYGNFDSTVTFPNGATPYRKIYMYFTLGKYVCPGSPQYCSDWDYTVQTLLMGPTDTFELGRFITPYAKGARMPASWKGVYKFDVTDYYPLLKNNATVRVHYSGYSGGFTADVKFAFIEGTPPRNVLGHDRVWKGSYNYGHGSVAINDALNNVSLTAPPNTVSAEAKFTITGHGGDANNAAEFYPNSYTLNLNNAQLVQQNFWRNDCGSNWIYPQSGTWIYDRAGWCPGDLIKPFSHTLTGVGSNSSFTLNATFPPYTSSGGGSLASYIIENNIIYYAGFNHTLDASVEDILAPTNDEMYFRMNPLVGKPTIRVKNNGSTQITSLKIEYGVVGKPLDQYTWTGNITSLNEQEIKLPEPWELRIATGSGNGFVAKIVEVNGQADQDVTNNEMRSTFEAAPKWDVKFRVSMQTNGGVANGVSETSWKIFDLNDNVVAQRINAAPSTTYEDTITLGPAVYRLEVFDAGCDGLNWWAYPPFPQGPGAGSFFVKRMTSSLPLVLKGYFGGDFGCGFTQYFRTDWPTSVQDVTTENAAIEVFPNPAQKTVSVNLVGLPTVNGQLQLIDVTGRIILSEKATSSVQNLNISSLSNGIYSVVYSDKNGRLQTRLVIAR